MGSAALLLALGAATLHALWNLLLRSTRDTEATTAVAVVTFVVVLAPLAAATWDVEASAWKYIVPSGALELVYVALLAAAYRHFELSLVYPIARCLAPVATLVFAIALVSARPSWAEIGGFADERRRRRAIRRGLPPRAARASARVGPGGLGRARDGRRDRGCAGGGVPA